MFRHRPRCLFSLHYIAVDDLNQDNVSFVGDGVESLGLDIGRVHDLPCQIILPDFGVRCLGDLLRDAVNRSGTVDGLGNAHAEGGRLARKRTFLSRGRTCVCLTQFNILVAGYGRGLVRCVEFSKEIFR